jgi:hypothetical protein
MTELKLIPKETWIPIGVVGTIIALVFGASVYISNLSSSIASAREDIARHIASDDARVAVLTSQVQSIQQSQAKAETKLDFILQNLDEIKKKLNIN